MSEIARLADALHDDALAQMIAKAQDIGELKVLLEEGPDSIVGKIVFNELSGKSNRGSRGGGGGGGKSDAQKLIEQIKREREISDHRLKMLQYSESYYEGRGETTNVNRLIIQENDLRYDLIGEYEDAIDKLTKQMSQTKKESDDWYSLREAILSYEEAIEECNNAIDENIRKLRENQQAIRKTRIDLENDVDAEIKNRIQRERDMLDGTVSMQNMILDAIKARYQEEWDILNRDIDKKRQALEEEKNLIDERLNKRKEAADEAEKYEELAELKRQYAMISMDSTRTKDAAALREKISDIEKDLAWDLAEDEAKAQQDAVQDKIDAYDQYVQNGEEDLQYWLEDANNFATEINSILYEQQETLFDWMKENIKEYAKTLEEAQKQMVNSWEDTFKQMHGITDTFWDQVDEILSSEDSFLEYMMQSQDFINASATDQEYMLEEWRMAYEAYLNAMKDYAEWFHEDEFDNVGTSSTSNNPSKNTTKAAGAVASVIKLINDKASQKLANDTLKAGDHIATSLSGSNLFEKLLNLSTTPYRAYVSGGLVDYTGPAWVDGTPERPESFLDAEDTALLRKFLDASKYVRIDPLMSNINASSFVNGGSTIGDINITITEASFEGDADIEEVAHKVGEAFVRELGKTGFMTANYAF